MRTLGAPIAFLARLMPNPIARALPLVSVLLAMGTVGCSTIPEGRSAVDEVSVVGADEVDADDIRDKIATSSNPRFLGMFEGVVYDYAVFNRFILERDLARVERYYRARGYYEANVRAGRIFRISDDEVQVEIVVDEGPMVAVAEVKVKGASQLDPGLVEDLRATALRALPLGGALDEDGFKRAAANIKRMLTDAGYAWADVERSALVDIVAHQARVELSVEPGPKATFGEITIEGLGELPEEPLRTAIDIDPGDPYSTAVLEDAHRAALDLGVFSSVQLAPDLDAQEEQRVVPVKVRAAPSTLRSVKLGGGVTLDALKSDVHLRAGWEDRNFLGGMRRLTVDARPGVVLYPLRINNWVAPEQPLPHAELRNRLAQPGLFEARTTGFIEPNVRVFPVLLKTDPQPEDPVIGYLDLHGQVGLERRLWKRIHGTISQHVQYALPFAYLGEISPFLSDIILTYPEIGLRFDLRDDPVHPHQGILASTTFQAAFHEGRDLRVVPELAGYLPLGHRYLTLAARTKVGFLFPFNYGDTIDKQLASPEAGMTEEEVHDLQLMYFRGLFAGGPSSNRGYPPQTISPHAVVPFLNPQSQAAKVAAGCQRGEPGYDPVLCSVPIGGRTLWELSLELRFPIAMPLLGATFCDAADVAPDVGEFRPDHPHLSCGAGLRYDTPVGPIRLDVAYRIPGMQVLDEDHSAREEGDPGDIFGAPINIAFGIGESF
jgi:outer membrane protein insertion porin family/translocation and assembly module TamA